MTGFTGFLAVTAVGLTVLSLTGGVGAILYAAATTLGGDGQ